MSNAAPKMCEPVELFSTEKDLEKLDHLILQPPSAFSSAKKRRKLRIIRDLYTGVSGAEIARREGLSPQQVSNIRQEMAAQELSAWLSRISELQPKLPALKRPHAGRPGYENMSDWKDSLTVDDESVFELATLFLAADVQIATIAVRRAARRKTTESGAEATNEADAERLRQMAEREDERIRKTLREIEHQIRSTPENDVYWTEVSNLDDMLKEVFFTLGERLDELEEEHRVYDLPDTYLGDVIEDLVPLDTRFHPSEGYGHVILYAGVGNIEEFLEKLIGGAVCRTIYVTERYFLEFLEAVIYQRRMRNSCVGFLPLAWDLLDDANQWEGGNFALPFFRQIGSGHVAAGIQYALAIRDYFAVQGILCEMDSSLWNRAAFRDEIPFHTIPLATKVEDGEFIPDTKEVCLAVRPLPEIQYKVTVPWADGAEKLQKLLRETIKKTPPARKMLYSSRWKSDQLRESIVLPEEFFSERLRESARDGVGVMLLPRHFLTPASPMSLQSMHELSGGTDLKIDSFTGSDGDAVLFYAPAILTALGAAFEKDWYVDRLRYFSIWERKMMHHSRDRGGETVQDWIVSFMKFARQTDREVPESSEAAFLALLKNVDADFLLAGVDPVTRMRLDEAAEQWTIKVAEVVLNRYWPGNVLNIGKVKSLAPQQASYSKEELEDLCTDALTTFRSGKKVVLRAAIENMQRAVLHDLPPVPVTIEPHRAIYKRWEALLRATLSRLSDPKTRGKVAFDDKIDYSDVSESDGRTEAEEFVGLVRSIETDPRENSIREFFDLSRDTPESVWTWVPFIIDDPELNDRIAEAARLCRDFQGGDPSVPLKRALKRLLSPKS